MIGEPFMVINIHNVDLEIHYQEYWYDSRIVFYTDPGDKKYKIIQYLYNEGFILDRRTPYTIKELS